jgi:WD40 repeat protein
MALYFEPANLVDRLIDEVGQMPGALPLLSFTLSELYIKLAKMWEGRESSDRALTIDAEFDKEGGVAGSLTRRANEEYKKLGEVLGEFAQRTMRQVMLRMLTLEGGETARRRVPESELVYPTQTESDRAKQVVERLAKARLLVKGQLETGEPCVEPAHDFLVRGWGILQDWINQEKAKETLELRYRLTAQTNDWARNNRPDGLLLLDGERLNQAEKLLYQDGNGLNQQETQFIRASVGYRDIQRKQSVKAELQEKAASVSDQLSVKPLNALLLSIQITGQNLEKIPDEILTPVQRSLNTVMNKVRVARNTFRGHSKSLTCVTFSPNGQFIASGSADCTIRIWDWRQNLVAPAIGGHDGAVNSVVFGSNSQYVISGSSDSTIRIWNFKGEALAKPFLGHDGEVKSIAISPDGQCIVSGGSDGTICLWSWQGELIKKILVSRTTTVVNSVAISPDGQYIASGNSEGIVHLWNFQGQLIGKPFVGHEEGSTPTTKGVHCVAFSPDSQSIASGSADKTVRLWNLQGELILQPLKHNDEVLSIAFDPTRQRIVTVGGRLCLWTLDGIPIEYFMYGGYKITSVAFSPDGRHIVGGSVGSAITVRDSGSYVKVWDLEGNELGQPLSAHTTEITALAFSADGKKLASSSFDKTIRLWNLEDRQLEKTIEAHQHTVSSIAFNQKGDRIVSGSYDCTIRLWNLQGKPIGAPFGYEDVRSVAFSPDGQNIASTGMNYTVHVWDLEGNLIRSLPYSADEQPAGFNKVAFSPDGHKIACLGPQFRIRVWDWKQNLIQDSSEDQYADNVIQSIAFSPCGRMIITSDVGSSVCLWDLERNFARKRLRHTDSVYSACFSPNGQLIASVTGNGQVVLWDKKGDMIATFQTPKRGLSAVAFSRDGEMIASGAWDGIIQLWQANWKAWLQVCCDRLRYDPVLTNPETIQDLGERQIAIAACETCRKYVWNKEDISV